MKNILFGIIAILLCAVTSCTEVIMIEESESCGVKYFRVTQGEYVGCMDMNKNEIIPLDRKYTQAYPEILNPGELLRYKVIKNGFQGVCDTLGNEVIPPKKYTDVCYIKMRDFPHYYAVTNEDGEGACNILGEEIISPQYHSLFYTLTGFMAQETDSSDYISLGILLNEEGMIDSNALSKEKIIEDDGFEWYKLYQNGCYGAETVDGTSLIPLSRGYTDIMYWDRKGGKKGYFECEKEGKEGVCTIYGTEIIAPIYSSVIFIEKYGFKVQSTDDGDFCETGIVLANNGKVKAKEERKRVAPSSKHSYTAANAGSRQEPAKKKGKWRKWLSGLGKVVEAVASVATGSSAGFSSSGATGPHVDYIPQKDGTTQMVTRQVCYDCKGSGRCSICGGNGAIIHPYLGTRVNCTLCSMSGRCKFCKGTGEQVFRSVVDAQGNGYSVDMNGNVVTVGGSGGGSSSTKSSSSSSSSSSKSNDYIDVIEYSPNYTGQDNTEWCDVCKKYAPAHKHIKKRY